MKDFSICLPISLLLFALINLSSCTTDLQELNESKTIKTLSNPNPENPLEIVGVLHNEALASFMNEITTEFQNGEWDNIEYGSEEYIEQFSQTSFNALINRSFETDLSQSKIKHIYKNMNLNEWSEIELYGILSQTKNTLAKSKSTSKDKEFTTDLLNDIFEVLENSNSDDEALINLELVISKNENLILSQEWAENETYALGAIAVAKHSLIFWKDFDFTSIEIQTNGKPEKSIIVGADIAGYVVGGVVGGVSGSFAGPAGTVVGVLGGKVGGAWIASSAASAGIGIYKAWRSFFS